MSLTDAERVAAIERKAELRLLERLLIERERPVPPTPEHHVDPTLHNQMIELLELIAEAVKPRPRLAILKGAA